MPPKPRRYAVSHAQPRVLALLLCLALPHAGFAQPLRAGCPEIPEPPEFVSRVVSELDALQPHTERWHSPLHWQRLLRELDRIRLDGLNPAHYMLSDIARASQQQTGAVAPQPCAAELASLALAWSLKDLSRGRLNPGELGLMWHHQPLEDKADEFARTLHQAFHGRDGLRKVYQSARPGLASYRDLRSAYRTFRRLQPESWPAISPGPTLRQGDGGQRVGELARRLAAQGYLPNGQSPGPGSGAEGATARFDQTLTQTLVAFQRDHGLEPDGIAGKKTLAALNLPPAAWAARVRANLERLRWISPYLREDMILVDIAGARAYLFQDGAEVWRGNVQVGRPERKTPALTSVISHITVNPTWTIPPTIFYEDALPAIRSDPDYLARNRLTVLNHSGNILDPEQVDWSRPGRLVLRQSAGPGNALGEVAIRFPNPFSVYLHDTPARQLFETPDRFYSSGCVRVENAVERSDRLFTNATSDQLQRLSDGRESGDTRNFAVPGQPTLVMAYWTAEGGPDGRVRFRTDRYEEDALVTDLLEGPTIKPPARP